MKDPKTIMPKNIGCVGAGGIGSSWAVLFALNEHEVTLYDVANDILERSLQNVNLTLDTLCESRVVDDTAKHDALSRIVTTTRLSDIGAADYVQESVIEDIETKVNVFKELENYVSSNTLLVSSTSGFPMTEIQRGLEYPERSVIAHPFTPPHLLPLVELVPGIKTSKKTVQTVRDFMIELGKVPVLINKEIEGFAANRIQAAILREILSLIDSDVVSMEDIEKIFYAGIGLRYAIMGPFAIESFNGGPGGLEQDFKHFKPVLGQWLRSMVTWSAIPPTAEKKALNQVKDLSYLKDRSFEELVRWRDKELIALLRSRKSSNGMIGIRRRRKEPEKVRARRLALGPDA